MSATNPICRARPRRAGTPIPTTALVGAVQTSRGCPFECEFCDVIEYPVCKQRHKPIANVIAELDQLYRIGYRTIFLADDNFTAYRGRCKDCSRRSPPGGPSTPSTS